MQSADVVIAGAGPVGSYAALNLAKNGVEVAVFEEHPQVGLPSHCAGHISIKSLRNMHLYPLPKGIVENTFCAANFYSPAGKKFSLHLSCPVTASVNRARFDQYLAAQAEAAGARFVLNSHVKSLLIEKKLVKGTCIRSDDTERKISSKIVIDAEGVSSRLLRQTGLGVLKPTSLVYGVEAEIEGVQNVEPDAVEVYLGKAYAPGFYAWLIPHRDGSAKIGLATNKGDPREYLERLMFKHPVASKQLAKAKLKKVGYHALTLGGPIKKAYTDGFLAVGDCASQVKPTTGGGVIFGLTCANIAAEVANEALKKGDVSSNFLQVYQKRCDNMLGFDVSVMLRLRRFLDSLSDEKLDEILQMCGRLKVDKALTGVDEIDFQGKLLLKVLGKPNMIAALAYFLLTYLSV